MDIISHGLWGSVGFGRKNRRNFWLAFFLGIAPDLFSFGIFFCMMLLGLIEMPDFSAWKPPEVNQIPFYVYHAYNVTHSLVIFGLVFLGVWIWRGTPWFVLCAWGFHIVLDIPTHSQQFFPTPFLWPLSDYTIHGTPWSTPIIFIPNVILLGLTYTWFWWNKKRR
ncbi:MAG: hypothetical protein ACSLEX_03270 [Minisyncoccota bacterium]